MSILNSVLGAVMNQAMSGMSGQGGQAAQPQQHNMMLDVVMGMLGGGGAAQGGQAAQGGTGGMGAIGGLGNILGAVGGIGGLAGLIGQFDKAGMGHVMQSWIGSGDNHAISGDQLSGVMGADQIGQIASQLGMNQSDTSSMLAKMLPEIINHVTPQGQVPQSDDLSSALGGLMGMLRK